MFVCETTAGEAAVIAVMAFAPWASTTGEEFTYVKPVPAEKAESNIAVVFTVFIPEPAADAPTPPGRSRDRRPDDAHQGSTCL